jgi:hypothetical protein
MGGNCAYRSGVSVVRERAAQVLRRHGTCRVVSYLTEELVRQGHDVTLYASGDSVTKARLVAPCRRSLRLDKSVDQLAHHQLMLELVAHDAASYDVIHFHPAYALLFPIDWPEPFGLVMIEALACGTPVIAYRRGSVLEVLGHGETGFIVSGLEDAVKAAEQVARLDRHRCRAVFENRFTAARMARDYVGVYERRIRRGVEADDTPVAANAVITTARVQ